MTRHTDFILRLEVGLAGAALLGTLAPSLPAVAGPNVDPAAKPESRRAETPVPGTPVPRTATAPVCPGPPTPAKPKASKAPPAPAGEPLPFFGPRGALAPHVV